MPETKPSVAEVTHVSKHGLWVLLDNEELLIPFEHFPWFKEATIAQLSEVQWPTTDHLYWPQLDVDWPTSVFADWRGWIFALTSLGGVLMATVVPPRYRVAIVGTRLGRVKVRPNR